MYLEVVMQVFRATEQQHFPELFFSTVNHCTQVHMISPSNIRRREDRLTSVILIRTQPPPFLFGNASQDELS